MLFLKRKRKERMKEKKTTDNNMLFALAAIWFAWHPDTERNDFDIQKRTGPRTKKF